MGKSEPTVVVRKGGPFGDRKTVPSDKVARGDVVCDFYGNPLRMNKRYRTSRER